MFLLDVDDLFSPFSGLFSLIHHAQVWTNKLHPFTSPTLGIAPDLLNAMWVKKDKPQNFGACRMISEIELLFYVH